VKDNIDHMNKKIIIMALLLLGLVELGYSAGDVEQDSFLSSLEMVLLIVLFFLLGLILYNLANRLKDKFNLQIKGYHYPIIIGAIIAILYTLYASVTTMMLEPGLLTWFSSVIPLITIISISIFHISKLKNTFKLTFIMLSAGVLVAVISFIFNQSIYQFILNYTSLNIASFIIMVIVAPIIEETLKFSSIYLIANQTNELKSHNCLIIGLSVGAGFASIENWFKFSSNPAIIKNSKQWISLIINRTIVSATAHGYFATIPLLGKFGKMFEGKEMDGLIMAIGLHMLFNILALYASSWFGKEIFVLVLSLIVMLTILKKIKKN